MIRRVAHSKFHGIPNPLISASLSAKFPFIDTSEEDIGVKDALLPSK